jgi:hypothetical protein
MKESEKQVSVSRVPLECRVMPRELFTKKQRRKLRSKKYTDMKPLIFDKLATLIPHVFKGML